MNCPKEGCIGTIAIFFSYDDYGLETREYFPCTQCRGIFRRQKMPEFRNNVPCPKPGCPGSRCDITVTDENGNWQGQRNEPCNVCGG